MKNESFMTLSTRVYYQYYRFVTLFVTKFYCVSDNENVDLKGKGNMVANRKQRLKEKNIRLIAICTGIKNLCYLCYLPFQYLLKTVQQTQKAVTQWSQSGNTSLAFISSGTIDPHPQVTPFADCLVPLVGLPLCKPRRPLENFFLKSQ